MLARKCFLIGSLGFVAAMIIACSGAPPAPPRPANPVAVLASKLVADYEQNEVAADSAYKGQWISVSGTVANVGKDILDTPFVALRAKNSPLSQVQCMFGQADLEQLATLKPGNQVTITGLCSGKLGNVVIENSELR